MSDYAVQLREKQKIRRIYGLLENQFRNVYKRADKQKVLQVTIYYSFWKAVLIMSPIIWDLDLPDQKQGR